MKANPGKLQKQPAQKVPEATVMILVHKAHPGKNMYPSLHEQFQEGVRRKRPVG